MPDDYPDNNSTTGLLWFNYPGLNANLETPGDVDWFYYPNTNTAAFVLTNAQFDIAQIIIRDANGGAIVSTYYGPAANAYINLQPLPQHNYHVSVQGFTSGGAPANGTYTIAAVPWIDDHGDNAGTTSTIAIDGPPATGAIDVWQDWDWFRIGGMNGEPVRIELPSAAFERVIIWVNDQFGNTVASYSGLTSGVSFIAPPTAYTIQITGFDAAGNWDIGAYSVAITSIPDDHGDTLATATPITLGETVNGVFEWGQDADWFAITLTAGQPLLVTLPDSVGEVRFYLENGNETEADIPPVRQNGQLTAGFVADTDGVYYIRVTGAAGAYTLNADISPYNPHDPANFPTLPANGYVTGYLSDTTDVAWYRVDLAAGETVSLQANFHGTNIVFYDTQGNEIASMQGATGRYITATEATTYYIALTGNGSYSLLSNVGADDFADGFNAYGSNVEPTGVLTVDGPAVSFRPDHPGDIDFFSITLAAGQSIEIIAPWWVGGGALSSGILFYDSAGNPLEPDFFLALTGSMTGDTQSAGMTATVAGTYYVSILSGGPSTVPYEVSAVTAIGTHPMDVSTLNVLTDGETVQGEFDVDSQWFAVELQAGQTFAANADGFFYDAYGHRIAPISVIDLTQDWFVYFTAAEAGTYYFHVYGDASPLIFDFQAQIYFDDAADWSVSQQPFPSVEPYPVLNTSGDQFSGRIEVYNDRDYFAFNLAADQAVRIRVEFTDLHSLSEELVVIGPDGQQYVGQLESVDGSEIVFTAPTAGTYYVEVDGLNRYIGAYTVTLTPVSPSDAYTGAPGILPASPAQPATPNVSATVEYSTGGTHTIDAGTVLFASNMIPPLPLTPIAVRASAPGNDAILNNQGMIYHYYTHGAAAGVSANVLINSGVIVVEIDPDAYYGPAIGVYLSGGPSYGSLALDNSGQIFALATGGVAGAIAASVPMEYRNSGLIAAHATWDVNDPTQSGSAYAFNLSGGSTVVNEASGQIIAEGDTRAVAINGGATVTNYGLIEAQTNGVHATSIGIDGGIIYNYGTIRADQAIAGSTTLFNYAGGVIDGDITLSAIPNIITVGIAGNDSITNQGTITGNIDMGNGVDTLNNTGGQIDGSVHLGLGDDAFVGGGNTDAVVGDHGDDNISGAGGQDLLLGSYGDDTIAGGAGNDGMYGEIGNDLLITEGADVASGGSGDDRFETGDYAFASLSGGTGFDTWVLPTGARTLDLALIVANGRVSSIEAVHLAGNQTLVVHPTDVAGLTDAGALYVSGAATNTIYLSGAWTAGAQVVRDGVTYSAYSSSGATVLVQTGIVTTVGTSPPTGTGLDAIAGGPAALQPGAVAGVDLSPAVITDYHYIIDHFVVGADEAWESPYGYPVFGAEDLTGVSLVNYGSIVSNGSTHPHVYTLQQGLGELGSATGISAVHIDDFENYGSIVATAILEGLATGFVGTSFDGTINGATGIIHAYADAGLAVAYDGFDGSAGWGDWAVHNLGDIYAFSNTGFAIGLSEHNGSHILNDGVIEANGGDGAIAVDLSNAGSGVWNRGQIIAYAPLTSTFVSVGIFSDGYTQIVNDGLIAAETAVLMRSRYQEDVTVTNTGTIIGDIEHTQPSSIALGAATINNSGDIFGSIYLSESLDPNSIVNSGYIEGNIFFGAGADAYQGGGQLVGAVYGGGGADNLHGGATSDVFFGEDGADVLSGGAGVDILDGGAGGDQISGGLGDDVLYVDNASDVIIEYANEGIDTVRSSIAYALGANVEHLVLVGSGDINGAGNSVNNTLTGNAGANTLNGGDGNDTLNGGLGVDTLHGGAGNDTILYAIGDGNGVMNGGDGTDSLSVSDGGANGILNATWNGAALSVLSGNSLTSIETITANLGGGIDWLVYAAGSAAVTVNLATGAASGFTSIANIERVVGGAANDTLTGNGLDNRLDGGAGDDTLAGGAGVDTLIGGDGADTISGGLSNDSIQAGAGDDTINWSVGDGRDTIDGGADSDTFNAAGTAAADLGNVNWNGSSLTALMDNGLANIEAVNLDLGGGVDWLIYNATAAVVVNLATNSASGFASVANIEKIIGGSGDDTLTGDGADNRLDGLGGADTLDGGAGSDAVLGGDGDDVIYASAGNDSLQGQNGNDMFIWTSTDGRDTFNGGADTDTASLTGSAVADVADANWNGSAITGLLNNALIDIETINLDLGAGGAGGDWLRYNTSSAISVDLGAGTATGFASITGVENLIGGTGADNLTGDGGVNKINGANGDDTITGGAGNDNLTGGAGNDTFVYAAGCGNDTIVDFDAWAVGGQDFLDVSAFGINAGNFAARVAIIDVGSDTVIRIDDAYFITLKNVTGDGDNAITQDDFFFGP